ncbi:transposable element Tc1 transposase [Trichonephila clavipes]|nr:transposable element Tc1 transposase [Trichonephila clavipes]
MNIHLQSPVSMKTIQRELHAVNIHGRISILKPSVSVRNAMKRQQRCREHLNQTKLQWEQVIWSDESSFTLVLIGCVFVWRTPAEAFHVDCLVAIVKHGLLTFYDFLPAHFGDPEAWGPRIIDAADTAVATPLHRAHAKKKNIRIIMGKRVPKTVLKG